MFKNIFFKKSKMNYRRWLNVSEKSSLEKFPTVVECFAKMNECFRESYLQETFIKSNDIFNPKTHILKHFRAAGAFRSCVGPS